MHVSYTEYRWISVSKLGYKYICLYITEAVAKKLLKLRMNLLFYCKINCIETKNKTCKMKVYYSVCHTSNVHEIIYKYNFLFAWYFYETTK